MGAGGGTGSGITGPAVAYGGSSSAAWGGGGGAAAHGFKAPLVAGAFIAGDRAILLSAGDTLHAFAFSPGGSDPDEEEDEEEEDEEEEEGEGGELGPDGVVRRWGAPVPLPSRVVRDVRRRAAAEEDVGKLRRRLLGDERAWYAPVAAWKPAAEVGASVVAMAAHNGWAGSPLLFTACSDRSVRLFDMARAGAPAEVLRIPDAHARAIRAIALPSSSACADVAQPALDCFLTASTDGPVGGGVGSGGVGGLVRLWDLRAGACVRQMAGGHVNRVHTLAPAFSPCLTQVAIGSEDRAAVVYDLRMTGASGAAGAAGTAPTRQRARGAAAAQPLLAAPVARLTGARDVVTTVAWHPRTPHLLAGSLDGGLRCYAPHRH